MTIKTQGFNIPKLEKNNSDNIDNIDSVINIKELDIEKELKLKNKKINFDKVFPALIVDKCMGLCDLNSEKHNPFKELLK